MSYVKQFLSKYIYIFIYLFIYYFIYVLNLFIHLYIYIIVYIIVYIIDSLSQCLFFCCQSATVWHELLEKIHVGQSETHSLKAPRFHLKHLRMDHFNIIPGGGWGWRRRTCST